MDNSTVTLTNRASYAFAVISASTIAASGDRIELAGEGGFGLDSGEDLSLRSSTVTLTNPANAGDAVNANGTIAAQADEIKAAGNGCALVSGADMTVDWSSVTMSDVGGKPCGLHATEKLTASHDTVVDLGDESAVHSGGALELSDSTVLQSPTTEGPAAVNSGGAATVTNVSIQAGRSPAFASTAAATVVASRLRVAANSSEPAIEALDADLTLDSTLVSGGAGLAYIVDSGERHDLTVSATTLDAGTPGVRGTGASSLIASTDADPSSSAHVHIDASILLVPPASVGEGVTIECVDSEVPEAQPASTLCAPRHDGNTYTPNIRDIFASRRGYQLNPAWSGVDSIDPQTIRLPGGLTPSSTDAAGHPRVQNASAQCPSPAAWQDKGAFELPGHTNTCGQTPTSTPTTPSPTDPPARETAAPPTREKDAPPTCTRAQLTLTDVAIGGRRVVLRGVADRKLVTRRVEIFSRGRRVANAVVQRDGSFGAFASLPPVTIRNTNQVRYQARIGSIHSLSLKLTRRLVLLPPVSREGKVTLRGRVLAPLTQPPAPISLWQENPTCTRAVLLATFRPDREGHYAVSVPIPANRHGAIYRLRTRIRATARNPHTFTTYSLTESVKLR